MGFIPPFLNLVPIIEFPRNPQRVKINCTAGVKGTEGKVVFDIIEFHINNEMPVLIQYLVVF